MQRNATALMALVLWAVLAAWISVIARKQTRDSQRLTNLIHLTQAQSASYRPPRVIRYRHMEGGDNA